MSSSLLEDIHKELIVTRHVLSTQTTNLVVDALLTTMYSSSHVGLQEWLLYQLYSLKIEQNYKRDRKREKERMIVFVC